MATATMSYGLTVTIGSKDYGFTSTADITGVTKVFDDLVTVPNGTYATLLTFSATVANASLVTIKKVMIVNKETSGNPARIRITDTGADEYIIDLPYGAAIFLDSEKLEVSTSGGGFSAFSDFDTISAAGNGATAQLQVIAMGT